MDNKLVVVITHPNCSEVLPMPHAIRLNLTVTDGMTKELPPQTVNHFPKLVPTKTKSLS
jgi:hypothetical protein